MESNIPTDRRTIIVFDIENTDAADTTKIPHAIVCMPRVFQWAAFHTFLRVDQVQSVVFYYLFTDSLYGWRFLPAWCRRAPLVRVHWQVTKPPPLNTKQGEVPLNSSIYMPTTSKENYGLPDHVTFYDFSWFVPYVLRLVDAYTFRFGYTR